MLRRVFLGLYLVLALAVGSHAADIGSALEAHQRGDYTTAFKQFQKLAELDDPIA